MPQLVVEGYDPVEVEAGTSLLEACEHGDIPMESACGGFACCNSCRVDVIEGELSPQTDEEDPFLDAAGQRLGCQACILGPTRVRLAPGA